MVTTKTGKTVSETDSLQQEQPKDLQYDLVIIGAGMVGASLACALAAIETNTPLRIAVVEAGTVPGASSEGLSDSEQQQKLRTASFDPRVVALTRASQAFFDSFGAWDTIAATRMSPYRDMHVWDGEGTGSIHFDCREVQQDYLGHIVENSVAVFAIHQQLKASDTIDLLQPARVESLLQADGNKEGEGTRVILADGRCLQASLVVAADGANSFVRKIANFQTREWEYGHKAIVTTIKTERPHKRTAWQRFMASGPLALLPLLTVDKDAEDRDHYCSIVWSAEPELADQLMALDDEAFCRQLGESFEYKLGDITQVDKRFCIPLRQRHATQYIQPGIVLVGDAAHTIHPLAGQGVNLGLLDASALVTEIERALVRKIPLDDFSILRRYQRQRMGSNLGMMSAMEGFKLLFGAKQLPLRWLRNEGLAQVDSLPLLKNIIVKQAMGL